MDRSQGSLLSPFKIQLRSYKKADIEKYGKAGHKADHVDRDIHRSKWWEYGFRTDMTLEEARERAKQLNAQTRIEDNRDKRLAIHLRLKNEEEVECAYLPTHLVLEFENSKLRKKYGLTEQELKESKIMSHWRAAKRVIRAVQLDPTEWEDEAVSFYRYFEKHCWSLSYVEKILILLNKWGFYCAKKQHIPYLPIPSPTGRDRSKISDAYEDSDKTKKESSPLTFEALQKAKSNLKEEHYNWLYLSLWFGLRPSEVDSLLEKEGEKWKITIDKGNKILNMYQSKLTGLARDKRWKLIPCLFEEQEVALKIIQGKVFKRPLVKTVKLNIADRLTTYGGRKGFEQLLLKRGFHYQYISSYLGHQSVDRTWKSYRDTETAMVPSEQEMVKLRLVKKEQKAS